MRPSLAIDPHFCTVILRPGANRFHYCIRSCVDDMPGGPTHYAMFLRSSDSECVEDEEKRRRLLKE